MSFSTPQAKGYALLVTRIKTEVFLTEEEYQGIHAIMTHPNSGFTAAVLDDGSIISLSAIERVEVLPAKPKYNENQIDSQDPYRENDENEMAKKRQNWEAFKKKLQESGLQRKLSL